MRSNVAGQNLRFGRDVIAGSKDATSIESHAASPAFHEPARRPPTAHPQKPYEKLLSDSIDPVVRHIRCRCFGALFRSIRTGAAAAKHLFKPASERRRDSGKFCGERRSRSPIECQRRDCSLGLERDRRSLWQRTDDGVYGDARKPFKPSDSWLSGGSQVHRSNGSGRSVRPAQRLGSGYYGDTCPQAPPAPMFPLSESPPNGSDFDKEIQAREIRINQTRAKRSQMRPV
jgi:hypothetical protein